MKVKLLVILMLISTWCLSASTISGIISNKRNGQPIEFASIVIKETSQGAYTNNKGYFVITDVAPGTYTLIVSHVSFVINESTVTLRDEKSPAYASVELTARAIAMEEVTVVAVGDKQEVNSREIVISHVGRSTKQLLDVVQVAEPDVFRSILTLPGVTPIADFSSGLYVRGGSPDQNQILLDDIDVYNPSHFGGLFSTFNTDAVDNVELLKGGFPAKYGGRLSSVLDVRNRDGNRKHHQGVARLSLISASATVEGPWKLGSEEGSYMGSFRRSYLDIMRKAITSIPDYYFYDGHAKANWDMGQKDKLMISTYFGYDKLKLDFGSEFLLGWGNNTVSTQWVHIFNPQLFSHFVMAGSHFESIMEQRTSDNGFKRENTIDDISFKGMMSYKPNNYHLLEFGFETKYNIVDYSFKTDFDVPTEKMPDVQAKSLTTDFYIQDSWIINPFWTFQPGVRVTNYTTLDLNLENAPKANYWRMSPRASIRRKLTVDSNIYASYGRYYQFLTLISPGMSTPLDIWFPIDDTVKPGEADHYIVGYRHELMEGLGLDVELYYKDMNHLVEYNWDTEHEWNNNTGKLADIFHIGKGDAKGAEILLRTDKWGWAGFLGYTYCVTRKKLDGMNLNPETGRPEYFYPKYDRNHQLNLVQAFNITEQTGWQFKGADMILGITYSYATGQPTAVPEKVYFAEDHFGFLYSYADSERLPHYSRLDLSFKLQWHKQSHTIEPYIQVINATNRKNVFSRNYYVEFDEQNEMELKYQDSNQFPFIPFVGLNINW